MLKILMAKDIHQQNIMLKYWRQKNKNKIRCQNIMLKLLTATKIFLAKQNMMLEILTVKEILYAQNIN